MRTSGLVLAAAVGLAVAAPASAQEPVGTGATSYQLVFLVDAEADGTIPARQLPRVATAQELYLQNLVRGEVALVGGPLEDGDGIRYAAILDVGSVDEASRVFNESAGVRLGVMDVEAYSWRVPDNVLRRPEQTERLRTVYLALLKRPEDAPELSDEQIAAIQRGHLENVRGMNDAGDLIVSGPVTSGGDLRGVLLFKTQELDRINEFVARDPAVEAGLLRIDLYRWILPRGFFRR